MSLQNIAWNNPAQYVPQRTGVNTDKQNIGIASGIISGISSIGATYAQSSAYKVQEIQFNSANKISAMQAKVAAKRAALQGKADVMKLHSRLNKGLASDTVMAAAQNRRGGSVSAMASAATAKFEWDKDFTELSAKMQVSGYDTQAAMKTSEFNPYSGAGNIALIGGTASAITGAGMNIAESLYSIGGKDA